MYRKLAMLIVGSMVCIMAMPIPGQEGFVSQLYGNGVHAYFAGQYEKAYELFSTAIQAGTRDPRIYYFRGLAYLKLGREEEALEDFSQGAELETADVNQLYPVGRALQRVQGKHRLMLEQYREKARLTALNRQRAVERARYEGIQQRQQAILRQQAEGAKTPPRLPPIEAPPPPEKPAPPPFVEQPAEKPGVSPFEMPGEKPAEEPATKPTLPSPFEEEPAEKPEMKPEEKPETPEEEPEMKSEEETPAEKPSEEEMPAPNPFEEKPATKPTPKSALPSPFEEQPLEKPTMNPEEETKPESSEEEPEEKPEAAAEKPSGQAKSGGLLRGLWGAVRKTAEDITKPAGQTLEKVLPSGGGVAPNPGMPNLDVPVPPPFPGLPGIPGAEPGMEKPNLEPNPFEKEPADQPAGKPASEDPFAPAEKPSESAPEKPAEKLPLPKLPNPFE